MNMTTKI